MSLKTPYCILLVCTGNICRSPTAHVLFQREIERLKLDAVFEVDSAGTSAYHVGEAADPRTQATAFRHGVDMSALRARQFCHEDWQHFDLILVADRQHEVLLRRQMPTGWVGELALVLGNVEVPDPYYGGEEGFEQVFFLLRQAAEAWLGRLASRLSIGNATP